MNPYQIVVEAMPGTVGELAERTGYPAGQVLRQITEARRQGVRITATPGVRSDDGAAVTIFTLDDVTRQE